MEEIWLPVPGFPLYEVSNFGRVRSLPRSFNRGAHVVEWPGRELKGWVKLTRGRPTSVMVSMRRDGVTITDRVHRLVLLAFVGPAPHGAEGCHNDGDPLNNTLSNLRWDTHTANVRDSFKHGTKRLPPVHRGETHPRARLTDQDVAAIRATPIVRGVKAQLARRFGVSEPTIGRILSGVQREGTRRRPSA